MGESDLEPDPRRRVPTLVWLLLGILLLLQLRRCCWVGSRWLPAYSGRIRRLREAILTGVLRQILEARIHLLAEMIVHFLQVIQIHLRLRIHLAIRTLARAHAYVYAVVGARICIDAFDHVANAQAAVLSVIRAHVQIRGDHEDLERRIQRRRLFVRAAVTTGLP